MRRGLVTGASKPLGRRLVERLRASDDEVRVVAVDLASNSEWNDGTDRGSFELGHRALVEFLSEREIDTIVHCGLAPDRTGEAVEPSGADVIGTMRLCAAASDRSLAVRSLVLASSSSVYPTRSHGPLLHREDSKTDSSELGPAASLLEAEEYARDVAERAPHLCVAILRLAELAGPGVHGPLSSLLEGASVPGVVGFDPAVQLLHVDDAVRALTFAVESELAGVYNVASEGVVRWSDAVRELGRWRIPVLPLEAGPVQPLLRQLGLPHVPNGMLDVLRIGRAMDTAKLATAGCPPHFDQIACLKTLRG